MIQEGANHVLPWDKLGANEEMPLAKLSSSREPIGNGCGLWGDLLGSQSRVARLRANQETAWASLWSSGEPIRKKSCGLCHDLVGSQSCAALGQARGNGQEPIRSSRSQ